jgi:hypothetical protein
LLLLEKDAKAGLLEVVVAGYRVGNPAVLHHQERNAISEGPILVRALLE